MLKTFRTIGLAAWTLILVLIYFTTEIVADTLGWTKFVKNLVKQGPQAMLEAGYDSWLIAIFWMLNGGLIVSWGEFIYRRIQENKNLQNMIHFSIKIENSIYSIDEKIGAHEINIFDGAIVGKIHSADPKISKNTISLIVQFNYNINKPFIYVCADRKIIWREVKANTNYLILDLDLLSKEDLAFSVIVRPQKWLGVQTRDAALKWHDANVVPREKVLSSPSVAKKRRWLPNIAQETQRQSRPC